ncbi:dihydrofolate reductase family protein [Allonocardiopsis opalescens]|uniref:Dihydrofolate reductase n=1 Tax=Allonocardiopsis opalescens TaxID=1144618 RepID=A0A2T0Q9Q6_9ACTN|nr:dihydrofolate reductase family protein [Allonocardiopsis opalescens]PRY00575.1 dihydrofolate reductase [Allonocardiopsis opalescens]
MGKVVVQATMSLDGFIADPSDQVGPLFDWYGNGEVEVHTKHLPEPFRVSKASAAYLGEAWSTIGAQVIGRRLFDITDGWGGSPVVGDAVFVVTHEPPVGWRPDAPFTFVTDGLASAVEQARRVAGERDVSVTGGDLCGQALAAGLVDELRVDLAPAVFGSGVRFFGDFVGPAVLLDDPKIVQGDRVTHLHYRVRKG